MALKCRLTPRSSRRAGARISCRSRSAPADGNGVERSQMRRRRPRRSLRSPRGYRHRPPGEGGRMSTIPLPQTTTSTPEQLLAALIDFGPGRSQLFGNSADEYLKVYHRGPSEADVTEGSGGIWERLHYDWSDRNRVVMKTTDSNLWGGSSGQVYTFTRRPGGTAE